MNTTKELLPAINNLYDIGLTEEDIDKLRNATSTFQESNLGELSLWYFIDTPGAYVTNSDPHENGPIVIHRKADADQMPPDEIERKTFLKKFSKGYVLSYAGLGMYRNMVEIEDYELYLKDIQSTDKDNLELLEFLMGEFRQRNLHTTDRKTNFNTPQDAIQYFVQEFKNEGHNVNSAQGIEYTQEDSYKKAVENIKTLFAPTVITQHILTDEQETLINRRKAFSIITDILEVGNYRFVFRKHKQRRWSYYNTSPTYSWTMVEHSHPSYNYCDVGRLTHTTDRGDYDIFPIGERIFEEMDPIIPSKEVLNDEWRNSPNVPEIVSNKELSILTKRYSQRLLREQREVKARQVLKDKTEEKLNTLKYPGKTLKINEVVYSKDSIEYQGQTLKLEESSMGEFWVKTLLQSMVRTRGINSITFDDVLSVLTSYLGELDNAKGTIGEVAFDIEKRVSTNSLGVSSSRLYVNDKRINKDETGQVLERALCYTSQEDYNYFIKSVSQCSLFIHKYLQLGIDINVRDDFDRTSVQMKFPLERRRGSNYLVLGDREFKVSNTKRLINLRKAMSLIDVINILLSGKVVQDVEATDIKTLIADGKQEYIDAVTKSKELLKETEELFKLHVEELEVDGRTKRGYKINGKIRTYFLENNADSEEHNSCGVYDYNTGKYICIVDKSTSQVGMDKLVNRIYALHNDALVAGQINTLNNQ